MKFVQIGFAYRAQIIAVAVATLFLALAFVENASSAAEPSKIEPIKLGFAVSLSGSATRDGTQLLSALELWRDDVNAQGGLLGRPIELVYYDDQSNPAKELRIYRKLLGVDKVQLVIGPYGTIAAIAAMRGVLEFDIESISVLGPGANRIFDNKKYFSMSPAGSDGLGALAKSFFDFADQLQPKPRTVAILASEVEPAKSIADDAGTSAVAHGFTVVYDKTYPPTTTDFDPLIRELQAADAEIVFVAASADKTSRLVQAVHSIGLAPKLFGGSLPGLQSIAVKAQLGPLLNGIVSCDNFVPAPTFNFPGLADLLNRYRHKTAGAEVDPLGYEVVPFAYAAGQVLAQAVEQTKSIDAEKLGDYIHNNHFTTVVGDIEFGRKGEWKHGRMLLTQFQHVSPNNIEQFADAKVQLIVWPLQYRTGELIYPYGEAKKQ